MSKLIERDSASGGSSLAKAPALAVQFFVIPLAVVGMVVLVYGGFRLLLTTERTPEEFLQDVQTGGRERRWPAAYELSRLISDPDVESRYPTLGASIVEAFEASEGDDPRVRRYLALALGRLVSPPPTAVGALVNGLKDPNTETKISVIWALAALGDGSVREELETMYDSDDSGVRKMAVYALGAIPGALDFTVLQTALTDSVPDVQWNAAVALARQGKDDGLIVLTRMLDREYVTRMVTRVTRVDAVIDPISEVMVSGLQAIRSLRPMSVELKEKIDSVSRNDESLRVREMAIRTLEMLKVADDQPEATLSHRR